MKNRAKESEGAARSGEGVAVQADLCRGLQINTSAGLHEGLQMSRNLGRRELIEPMSVSGGLEFPLLDCDIEDKTCDAVDQGSDDSHLGEDCSTPKRSDRRTAKDGIVVFERAVGSLGCRSQSVQLSIAVGSLWGFPE